MRTLNPAMKFVTLLCVTFVLAFRYNPVLNLAVFVLCMAALLVSKVRLKTLGLLMLPILLAATGMFFTGYRFSADASMPVAAADFLVSGRPPWRRRVPLQCRHRSSAPDSGLQRHRGRPRAAWRL